MGIFDLIELRNHLQAIQDYHLYIDGHRDEYDQVYIFIADHIKKSLTLLDKLIK